MKLEPRPTAYEPLSLGLPALRAIRQGWLRNLLVSLPGVLAGLALIFVGWHLITLRVALGLGQC